MYTMFMCSTRSKSSKTLVQATFNETNVHVHVFTLYKDTNGRPTRIF